jgi:hypothetical protein
MYIDHFPSRIELPDAASWQKQRGEYNSGHRTWPCRDAVRIETIFTSFIAMVSQGAALQVVKV